MKASADDRATRGRPGHAGPTPPPRRVPGLAVGLALGLALGLGACRDPGDSGHPQPASETTRSSAPLPTPVATETPASAPEGSAPRTADPSEFIATADREAIQRTISAQIEALRRDDASTAFSFAAPVVQDMFETPAIFFRMVLSAYAPLYRPRYMRFGETTMVAGEITQKVMVVDEQGRPVVALYLMDRQPDGTRRIMGCLLLPSEETPA